MNKNTSDNIITNPKYVEQDITEYQGNPLIECLPPILSAKELLDKTFFRPEVPDNIENIPPEKRFQLMNRIKDAYFPSIELIDIERNISSMIRRGYILRNPLRSMENFGVLNVLNKIMSISSKTQFFDSFYCDYTDNDNNCITYSIIGYPGMGKTKAVNKIKELYPLYITHNEYNGKPLSLIQIPILKMECSSNGIKGFCLNFFSALDILLKSTAYAAKYGKNRNGTDDMLMQMEILAAQFHIGLLVVDEIQHLAIAGSDSAKIMNFLVKLTNEIHIPILFVGTPSSKKVFGKDLRLARRMATEGMCAWDRMTFYDKNNMPDKKWDSFMRFIWKFQYLNHRVEFNQEFSQLMYQYSQGITAIAIALFILTQRRALEREEQIEPRLIKEVADKQLIAVKPILEALRSGKQNELEKYQDINFSVDSLLADAPKSNESIIINFYNSQDDGKPLTKEKTAQKQRASKQSEFKDKKDLRYIFRQAQHNKTDLDVAFKEAGYLRELGEKLVI